MCERCGDGYFSNSSSAKEPCVKHQQCAPGQTALLSGSVDHDAVCGTCNDLASGGETTNSNRLVFMCKIHISSWNFCCSDDTYRAFVAGFFRTHRMRVRKMKKFVARWAPLSFFFFLIAQNLFRYPKAHTLFPSVRFLQKPGRSVPRQRGPLLEQMTSWLAEARHERLRKLLETLRATQLNSLAKKLEKTLSDIQQRNPGCSLIWHRSAI